MMLTPLLSCWNCYLRNSYTTVCPHVQGDNVRALASGVDYLQHRQTHYDITMREALVSVELAQYEIYRAKACKSCNGSIKP